MNKTFNKLVPFLIERRKLNHLLSTLNYDIQTTCPEKAIEEEGEIFAEYAAKSASLFQNEAFLDLVKQAKIEGDLTPQQKLLIDDFLDEADFMSKISMETYTKWHRAMDMGNAMWRKYRPLDDFASYLPYWEASIEAKKEELKARRKPYHKTLYDVALDQFEKGNSQEKLDAVFNPLKEYLVSNLPKVLERQKGALPTLPAYPKHKQEALAYDLLRLIGYDLTRGALRESAHPFSDMASHNDTRITCHYRDDFSDNMFTVLHEGGHCMQFQNWPASHYENFVEGRVSAAQCETHSRFYENLLGRSKELAPHLKELCQKNLGDEFASLSIEDFHRIIHACSPGLIRCNADEFTYCLHIIVRYEIERDLINGDIECKDVPAIWKAKYKEYLGIDVPNDKDGCMQDVHWSDGEVGYFPSYALGNLYGAQIKARMEEDIDVASCLRKADLEPIRKWLAEKDFAYDYLDPDDWIKKVTGEEMNPNYFIKHLEEEFLQ